MTRKTARKALPKTKPKLVVPRRKFVAAKPKPAEVATVEARLQARLQARLIAGSIPYLEVAIREQVSEDSMVRLFENVRSEILRCPVKRVLVDLRQGSVALTFSDLHGLAKLVATAFVGVLERLALVLRPEDVPAEKFFESSVNNRGLPTWVTADAEEATYWIAAKLRPVR